VTDENKRANNVEFVRPGTLASSHTRLLAGLQRSRELADYDSSAVFSADDAKALVETARALEAAVDEILRADGWTDRG
jgi:hypothetical protein